MKNCFVISPIGKDDSEVRRTADLTLRHLIEPACTETGFEAIRADKISDPGIITSQVINHIIKDEMVIADLTGHNPNVFYELAIRHTVCKPVVQIIQKGEQLPFDIAHSRTIFVDLKDLDNVADCRLELIRQIRGAEANIASTDTPVSVALDWESLRQSENPIKKSHYEIVEHLKGLKSMLLDVLKDRSVQQSPIGLKLQSEITIDYSSIANGGKATYEYDLFSSFQNLLDHCWGHVMSAHFPEYTYGIKWLLINTRTDSPIHKEQQDDFRTLRDVGIEPGAILRAVTEEEDDCTETEVKR